ncbi:MAG: metal-dependent hydrolase [Candidatus Aenigmarchaeota archaeon]|nr:metal-dependent hydrolase [Candidatus Aenigmarchaeota archaeon]
MNTLLHFFLSYLVVEGALGNAYNYAVYILLFSVILDLDHIPYVIKTRRKVLRKKFGSESRSRFHELYGLTLFSAAASLLAFFSGATLAKVIALSAIVHYAADFLVGKSRPFYPFSKKEISLGMLPDKYRMHFEIASTLILGAVVWLSIVK